MYFKQFYLGCLSHASYLIADEGSKTAVVVDPQRDVDQYVDEATKQGFLIRGVLLTHFHADFLAGHVELRERTGATIYLGAKATAEYAFQPVKEGDKLNFGQVRLQIIETPGHTPESICVLVFDRAKSETIPHAILTGDTLFIGDVGRPDLMASVGVTAEQLAGMLYDSLHKKILPLPDQTLVYPAHGAGSMCGKNLSKDTFSDLGTQRKYNYALLPMSKSDFIRMVTTDQPDSPAYFSYDAELNRKERPTLERSLSKSLKPLEMDTVIAMQTKGAQILDVRDPSDFAAGHIARSLNIGLGGRFAQFVGTLLDHSKLIILVAEGGREQEAAMRLGRIGFDNIAGFLVGGPATFVKHPELIRKLDRVTVANAYTMTFDTRPPTIIDVRYATERRAGHIDGSVHIPLHQLKDRMGEIAKDVPTIVQCAGGYRSSIACSVLMQNGYDNVTDMVGGYSAWAAAMLPVVTFDEKAETSPPSGSIKF